MRKAVIWLKEMKISKTYNISFFLIMLITTNLTGQNHQLISKVEKDVCPFEGCKYGIWVIKDTINVYAYENDTSIVKFVLHKNDTIKALTGDLYYERFGKIIVTKPIYGFNVNDTLIALRCTEGIFKVYQNGKQYYVNIFWPQENNENIYQNSNLNYSGKMIVEPKFSWWVQIRKDDQEGWLYLKNQSVYCFQIKERIEGMDSIN